MKGHFHGKILTRVSLDSNNGIYPLEYAIVESKKILQVGNGSWNVLGMIWIWGQILTSHLSVIGKRSFFIYA